MLINILKMSYYKNIKRGVRNFNMEEETAMKTELLD
jgi:hypothetical protein